MAELDGYQQQCQTKDFLLNGDGFEEMQTLLNGMDVEDENVKLPEAVEALDERIKEVDLQKSLLHLKNAVDLKHLSAERARLEDAVSLPLPPDSSPPTSSRRVVFADEDGAAASSIQPRGSPESHKSADGAAEFRSPSHRKLGIQIDEHALLQSDAMKRLMHYRSENDVGFPRDFSLLSPRGASPKHRHGSHGGGTPTLPEYRIPHEKIELELKPLLDDVFREVRKQATLEATEVYYPFVWRVLDLKKIKRTPRVHNVQKHLQVGNAKKRAEIQALAEQLRQRGDTLTRLNVEQKRLQEERQELLEMNP